MTRMRNGQLQAVTLALASILAAAPILNSLGPLTSRPTFNADSIQHCSTTGQPAICAWENLTSEGPGGHYVCTGSNGNLYSSGPVFSNVSFAAQASGGFPPYTFLWTGWGENASGAVVTVNFSEPTPPMNVSVSVHDTKGEANWVLLSYLEPDSPVSRCNALLPLELLIITVVAVLVIAIVLLNRWRTRAKKQRKEMWWIAEG